MKRYKGYLLEETIVYKYGNKTKQTTITSPINSSIHVIVTGINKTQTDKMVKNEINWNLPVIPNQTVTPSKRRMYNNERISK